jgi:hypothetical protein
LFLRLLRAHPAQNDSLLANQRKLMRRTQGRRPTRPLKFFL